MKKVNVGLIGFGTIGAGVVKALADRRELLFRKSGVDINIKAICDKDITTKRPVKVKKGVLTTSLGKVLYDPEIDIVIELVGGIHPAKDIILEALRNGKHVVTANKALISEYGSEIFGLAAKLGLSVGFEASVGGGIPIIRALRDGFIADRIDRIYGIVNGTSNFILSKMADEKLDFSEALKIAQKLGYAERDPLLDISGGDSAHKLAVLAWLGFGFTVQPKSIYTEGISRISSCDIEFAGSYGYEIKLLAIAKREGREIELRVHPTLIPRSHLLANVNGVYNAIFVTGDLVGDNLFFGRGAGSAPTSSAVVADIVAIAKGITRRCHKEAPVMPFEDRGLKLKKVEDVKCRSYVRISAIDKPGVLAAVSGILAKHKISIASVTQIEKRSAQVVPIIIMTHEALESNMVAALKAIDKLSMVKEKTVRIRVEE